MPPLPARVESESTPEDDYDPWALCGARSLPELPDANLSDTQLSADDAEIQQGQTYILTGNAVVDRAGRRIRADRIRYDEAQGLVQADGTVRLDQSTLSITGSRAALQLDTDQGEIHDVEYALHPQHARGQAVVARQESATRKTFEQATYTTCDAGHEAWRLNARSVTLKQDEGFGTARHVWLELADVPVLYTPYISFPIDDRRKSGLLVPSFGTSQNSGAEFSLPYYWNIAPHRDATITPRIMAKRGVQMQGEFRYLNPTNRGEVGVEYLPADSEFDDEDRSLVSLEHSGRPLPRVSTLVRAANVSDDQYFEDLGSDLAISSITHLQRLAQARYSGEGWTLTGRAQDFQTVDPTAREPYRRLPQLLFDVEPHPLAYGLEYHLDSELVQFDHDTLRAGTRLDMQPMLSLPQNGAAWFVTPSAGVRHTQYALDDAAGLPSEPSRTLPVVSLDSGLFFERTANLFGNGLLQTLEPRAFYLYVPHEDQSDLPDFDTSLRDFSFQQMFEDNRFSGGDRMGDANQLTLAATTRLLDPATGTQHASFSFGEILYFRDRDVTLANQPAEEQSASNLVAELDVRLSRTWKTTAGIQWDPNESKTELSNVRLQYRPDPRYLVNFAYRYRSDELEQIDTSALWHFTPRWHGVMRWNYSLPDSALLEALGGVEYESCCWILRVLGRSYISDTEGENNDAILLQLELKGLTSFGDPIESLLEDGILGYTRNRSQVETRAEHA
ncbi:MAG TPA: LPS assembly protein LptD, partial [Gammaproteobacteria bacterium]